MDLEIEFANSRNLLHITSSIKVEDKFVNKNDKLNLFFLYLFSLLQCQLLATSDTSYFGVLPTCYCVMFLIIAYKPDVLATILKIRRLHVLNVARPFSVQ